MSNELRNVLLSFGAVALMLSLGRGHYQTRAYAEELSSVQSAMGEYEERLDAQARALRLLEADKVTLSQKLSQTASSLERARRDGGDRQPVAVPQPAPAPSPTYVPEPQPVTVRASAPTPVKKTRRSSAS